MKKRLAFLLPALLLLITCKLDFIELPPLENPADPASIFYVGENGKVAAVKGFAISPTEESIDLSWSSPGAVGATVNVLRKADSQPSSHSDGDIVFSRNENPVSFSDTDLKPGTTYYYGIYASGNDQNSQMAVLSGKLVRYTITYNSNGATEGTVPVDAGLYKNGDTFTVKGNTGSLIKSGFRFSGWNTSANGKGKLYPVGMNFNFIAETDLVFYAQWEAVFPVTYDGNGSDSGIVPIDTTLYKDGDTVTVKDNTGSLTKSGYIFQGWNTKADGCGTSYAAAASFKMSSADVVLYAEWEPISSLVAEIVVADGEVTFSDSTTMAKTGNLTVSVSELYALYQWYLDGNKLEGETGKSVTLSGSCLNAGTHALTVLVTNSDGEEFSGTLYIKVTN